MAPGRPGSHRVGTSAAAAAGAAAGDAVDPVDALEAVRGALWEVEEHLEVAAGDAVEDRQRQHHGRHADKQVDWGGQGEDNNF